MERLMPTWPPDLGTRAAWELHRALRKSWRRFGVSGVAVAIAALLALAAGDLHLIQSERRARAETQLHAQPAQTERRPLLPRANARLQLKAFEDYLPRHAEIPTVIQDLIALAESEGLLLARGDYKPQPDHQAGLMRYRMTLPVKGEAAAIHRFMLAALKANRTLALESVQFKRERSDSGELEARIQWVLLTRLPAWVTQTPAGSGGRS